MTRTLKEHKLDFLRNLMEMTPDQLAWQYEAILEVMAEEDTHAGRESCQKQLDLVDAVSRFLYGFTARRPLADAYAG